jgi:hypothetical protein
MAADKAMRNIICLFFLIIYEQEGIAGRKRGQPAAPDGRIV